MENSINKERVYKTLTFLAIFAFGFLCSFVINHEAEEVVKYVEVVGEAPFDTSMIKTSLGTGYSNGIIHLVEGWWTGDNLIEDERGYLWQIENTVNQEDYYLLWIADNNTPDNPLDDILIRVWKEVF